jgi:hypothetical protein
MRVGPTVALNVGQDGLDVEKIVSGEVLGEEERHRLQIARMAEQEARTSILSSQQLQRRLKEPVVLGAAAMGGGLGNVLAPERRQQASQRRRLKRPVKLQRQIDARRRRKEEEEAARRVQSERALSAAASSRSSVDPPCTPLQAKSTPTNASASSLAEAMTAAAKAAEVATTPLHEFHAWIRDHTAIPQTLHRAVLLYQLLSYSFTSSHPQRRPLQHQCGSHCPLYIIGKDLHVCAISGRFHLCTRSHCCFSMRSETEYQCYVTGRNHGQVMTSLEEEAMIFGESEQRVTRRERRSDDLLIPGVTPSESVEVRIDDDESGGDKTSANTAVQSRPARKRKREGAATPRRTTQPGKRPRQVNKSKKRCLRSTNVRSRSQVSSNLSTIKTIARAVVTAPMSKETERALVDLCHMLWEVIITTPKFSTPGFSYTLASHTLVVLYSFTLGLPAFNMVFVPRVENVKLWPRRELFRVNITQHRQAFKPRNVTRCSHIIREALNSAVDHEPTKTKLSAFQPQIKKAAQVLLCNASP